MVDGPLDRETASEYNVSPSQLLMRGLRLSSSTSVITVHVSDVNDNAPRLLAEPVNNVYVKENSPVGSVIHTVSAFDPDLNENAKVSYSYIGDAKSASVSGCCQSELCEWRNIQPEVFQL